MRNFLTSLAVVLLCIHSSVAIHAEELTGQKVVESFLNDYCVRCHNATKSKGELSLAQLNRDLATTEHLEEWERVLRVLEEGEMPPEEEPQPKPEKRKQIIKWLHAGLQDRERAERARHENNSSPENAAAQRLARRLTNVEYQNTMRDLLGFEIELASRLPKDPVKAYRFNNTADFMRMGPEQYDLYLECARRAMASAIVDPIKPETLKTRREWKGDDAQPGQLPMNQVGVWGGNGRFSVAEGMKIGKFPSQGLFRLRIKAAAVLTPGAAEVPLRLLMGEGLGENSATKRAEPIGTIYLKNPPEAPEVYEFYGRIENYPAQKNRGKNNAAPQPDSLIITPQNLYNDGTLNDDNNFQRTRQPSMPRAVIEWMEFEVPLTETWPPEHHTRILFESPLRESNPQEYIQAVLQRFLTRAYRRPATSEEIERFSRIYHTFLPELKTIEVALRETLSLALITPQFLYHNANAHDEKATEIQYALASRLSYFLWASMPDEELLQLAAAGKLDNPLEIERQVLRLLADERSRDFVHNFTVQWLNLEKMRTVPINRDLFPRFLYYVPLGERAGTEVPYLPTIRDYMLEETVSFIGELIRTNANVLQIIDSDFACLNQPLAAHYGVDGVQGHEIRAVAVKPENQLGGLLTQGSVLIGNGTGSAPHPVYRAVWLREAILGQEVPPPPAEVPALTDSVGAAAEKALSIKELLVQHRQNESCNDCHSRLDPWGIPFEHYNAIGKYQPTIPKQGTRVSPFNKQTHVNLEGYAAYLQSINTIPVDADARLPLGPTVNGMQELKAYLLRERKEDITKNVLRRLLGYGIGRELTWRDRFVVEELYKQSQLTQHRLRDMIVAICCSPTFRKK